MELLNALGCEAALVSQNEPNLVISVHLYFVRRNFYFVCSFKVTKVHLIVDL
jgi:hypothetical protein